MQGMEKWEGTLAKVFNERLSELEPLMQSPSQLYALKAKTIQIIRESDISREQDKERAITIFNKIHNYSLFLSTLATYLTGIKVSWRNN